MNNHNIALEVENLSKQYRLGQVGTGTLSHDLNRWWHKIRGKDDPYLRIGESNDRTTSGDSDYVWALHDINFKIEQGDAVGIIGRNGAGKSTLLKLLSKVTKPSTGNIKVKGRIASLLEVGTGFHPEMTGRENIYLNGAILGMSRREIARKFDEIVDFAGVERYIDTPVKRYSSGMYVRLAFAVAAHLESEILIVDEVLAVGDAEFQKKCLGKMGDVSKGEGRTVLFVSHNMAAVKQLCNSGILLKNGTLDFLGKTSDVINHYLHSNVNNANLVFESKNGLASVNRIQLYNSVGVLTTNFKHNETIQIHFFVDVNISKVHLAINVKDLEFNVLFIDEILVHGKSKVVAIIPSNVLLKGSYIIDVYLYERNVEIYDSKLDEIMIRIEDLPDKYSIYDNANCGKIYSPLIWNKND